MQDPHSAPRALRETKSTKAAGVEIDPKADELLQNAMTHDTIEVVFELRPATMVADIPMTSDQFVDQMQRKQIAERFVQNQKIRYGESLKRLRSEVSMNLRGADDVPTENKVLVWGTPANLLRAAVNANVAKILFKDANTVIR